MYKVSFKIINNAPRVTNICDPASGIISSNPDALVFKELIEDCSVTDKYNDHDFEYSFLISYIRLDSLQGINHVAPSLGESYLTGDLAFDMDKSVKENQLPVIFISALDLFENPVAIQLSKAIRYITFLDSSIWFHYCSFERHYKEVKEKVASDQYSLSTILSTIVQSEYFSRDKESLYKLAIASEYVDLNIRLLRESFLGDGHGDNVSPFLFHSETKSKKEQKTEKVSKYQWRFLLLDDKIDKNKTDSKGKKTGILTSSDSNSLLTKADILKERINQLDIGGCECINSSNLEVLPPLNGYSVQIVCVETVEKARELMSLYEFDIILLDYLLKDDYGYQLLKELNGIESHSSSTLVGPQEKNFFMFISAFTTAVNERLTLESLLRDEKWWTIGEGACPTNTPELFKFRLLHLMDRRLEQTGIEYLSEDKILKSAHEIYMPSKTETPKQWIKSVRKRAYEKYHDILGYHYDYFILREYDRGKSVLVDSFLKDKVHMGAMLEHLLQLIHLTAFGTIRQWPEIWEEYKFFTRSINAKDEDIREFSKDIEDYIIELKSA